MQVPGTEYWVLKDDTNLTPIALKKKDIIIEKQLAPIFEEHISENDIVYDVGAFIGDTALALQMYTTTTIHAFEPFPDAFECLKRNCPGVKATNIAVGNNDCYLLDNSTINGNSGTRSVKMVGTSQKKMLELDGYMPVYECPPTFIKIDVEGTEPYVLMGMLNTIWFCKPKLLIEIYPKLLTKYGFTPEWIFMFLERYGYKYEVVVGVETSTRYDILAIHEE